MFGLLTKILLSPIIVFVIAYIYFGDSRKAVLVALLFYSALSAFSLFTSGIQIFLAMGTFNIFKFVKKSIKIVYMLVMLIFYWLAYVLIWGTNFAI